MVSGRRKILYRPRRRVKPMPSQACAGRKPGKGAKDQQPSLRRAETGERSQEPAARLAQGGNREKEPRASISGIVCKPHATCCHVMAELLRLDCNSSAFRDSPSESGFYRYLRLTLSPFLYYGAFLTVSPIFAPLFLIRGLFSAFPPFSPRTFWSTGCK